MSVEQAPLDQLLLLLPGAGTGPDELEGEYLWVYESFLLPAEDDEDGAQEAQYYFCELFEVPLDLDWEQVVRSKLVAYAYWPYVSEGKALDWDWTT